MGYTVSGCGCGCDCAEGDICCCQERAIARNPPLYFEVVTSCVPYLTAFEAMDITPILTPDDCGYYLELNQSIEGNVYGEGCPPPTNDTICGCDWNITVKAYCLPYVECPLLTGRFVQCCFFNPEENDGSGFPCTVTDCGEDTDYLCGCYTVAFRSTGTASYTCNPFEWVIDCEVIADGFPEGCEPCSGTMQVRIFELPPPMPFAPRAARAVQTRKPCGGCRKFKLARGT